MLDGLGKGLVPSAVNPLRIQMRVAGNGATQPSPPWTRVRLLLSSRPNDIFRFVPLWWLYSFPSRSLPPSLPSNAFSATCRVSVQQKMQTKAMHRDHEVWRIPRTRRQDGKE